MCNESYNANWSAVLDDDEVQLHRANVLVMATPAREGRHVLQLEYREPRLTLGLVIGSAVALCCLALLIIGARRAARRE